MIVKQKIKAVFFGFLFALTVNGLFAAGEGLGNDLTIAPFRGVDLQPVLPATQGAPISTPEELEQKYKELEATHADNKNAAAVLQCLRSAIDNIKKGKEDLKDEEARIQKIKEDRQRKLDIIKQEALEQQARSEQEHQAFLQKAAEEDKRIAKEELRRKIEQRRKDNDRMQKEALAAVELEAEKREQEVQDILQKRGEDKRVREEQDQREIQKINEQLRRGNAFIENPLGFALFEAPDIQRKNKEEQEQKAIEAREISQNMRARLVRQRLERGQGIPNQPDVELAPLPPLDYLPQQPQRAQQLQPQPLAQPAPLGPIPPKNYYLGKLIGLLGSGFIAKKYYDKKQVVFLKVLKKIKNSSLSSEEKELAIKELSKTWNKYGLKDLEDALYLGGAIGSVVIGCLADSARR